MKRPLALGSVLLAAACIDPSMSPMVATVESVEADSTAIITEYDLDGGYPITFVFVDEFPYWVKGAIMRARHRWSRVLWPTPVVPFATDERWNCGGPRRSGVS